MIGRDRRRSERRRENVPVAKDRRTSQRRQTHRRASPRVPLELWMEETAGDDVYFRRSGNVSEGGVYFDRAIPHDIGTVVTLKFALPGDREMVVARGRVVNAGAGGLGMGIKFIHIEGDGQKRIKSALRSKLT